MILPLRINSCLLGLLICMGPVTLSSSYGQSTLADACTDLARQSWGGFRIDLAENRPAEDSQAAHCFVRGTIDTEITFELLLPEAATWNGRFVMGGGGGYVGSVQNAALNYAPTLLKGGFATVGTDTGHQGAGTDASWALNRADREINFGYRAVHVTAQTAKTIIRLYYDRDIDYSYFLGCSRGGGQAMVESQRYPDDFDGIVAGAPAFDWIGIAAQFLQTTQAMYPDGSQLSAPVVRPETRTLLETAILSACDSLDGLEDGIMSNPGACPFRLDDLPLCATDSPVEGCVTRNELNAIRDVYEGPHINGERVHPGFPFGGEGQAAMWGAWIAGAENAFGPGRPSLHFAFGTQMMKYIVFDDPEWDYSTYEFTNWEKDTRRAAEILNATDTDLTSFNVAGGKIIYWTGWSDAALTAQGIIDYYNAVQHQHDDADAFTRLFLLPGVGHCAGGPGPDHVDWLGHIQAWVEEGKAPEEVVATKQGENQEILLQRPLCAYPAEAIYKGQGDGSSVDHFECVSP